jgi:RNA polymerase sigma-70 factor (ECF subfamily)
MQRSVEEAMASLPQSQREVLHLFYWDELSEGDIASALRMPEGSVKTLLFRGRNALRGRVLNLLPEVTS